MKLWRESKPFSLIDAEASSGSRSGLRIHQYPSGRQLYDKPILNNLSHAALGLNICQEDAPHQGPSIKFSKAVRNPTGFEVETLGQ